MPRLRFRRPWLVAAVLALGACTDRQLVLPSAQLPASSNPVAAVSCRVNVPEKLMECVRGAVPGLNGQAARGDKYLGGQDVYVKLTSSGTSYDSGTEILSSNVTVQNLLRQNMGTQDGSTVLGVKVFFANVNVTSGTGSVSVLADGTDAFTASGQPYYHYNQIIHPFEISSSRQWQFSAPSTVSTFTFTVYVAAPLVDEVGALRDRVWTGAADSVWTNFSNWTGGVPDSASVVVIPPDSLIAGAHKQPFLAANAVATHLRVGLSSSLRLNGFTFTAWGNVDAVGPISGGTLWMRGDDVLLGGTLPSVQIGGDAVLQRSTFTSGAVSVTGTLAVKDQSMSIQIP